MLNERSSYTMGHFQANNAGQMFCSLPPCGKGGKQKKNPPVRFHMDRKERAKKTGLFCSNALTCLYPCHTCPIWTTTSRAGRPCEELWRARSHVLSRPEKMSLYLVKSEILILSKSFPINWSIASFATFHFLAQRNPKRNQLGRYQANYRYGLIWGYCLVISFSAMLNYGSAYLRLVQQRPTYQQNYVFGSRWSNHDSDNIKVLVWTNKRTCGYTMLIHNLANSSALLWVRHPGSLRMMMKATCGR